jgi:hypothetical protein
VKSRFLTPGEKRDVVVAAIEALKLENPECQIHIEVQDWTDDKGVPQWTATIKKLPKDKSED